MTTTATLEAPKTRVRARSRKSVVEAAAAVAPAPVEIGSNSGEVPVLSPAEAKEKAIEMTIEFLRLKEVQSKALSAANAAEKALASFCKQNEVPAFAVKLADGAIYDAAEVAEKADTVDVVKLFAEVGTVEGMKMVSVAQKAVTDHGGKPLLAKVLTTVTKPLAFKVKKRK